MRANGACTRTGSFVPRAGGSLFSRVHNRAAPASVRKASFKFMKCLVFFIFEA